MLVTKYRRKDDKISRYAKNTFLRISESYHITLVEWNHDKDHVHIMFKATKLTESNTEIHDKPTKVDDDLEFLKHEENQNKQDLFKLKRNMKIS